MAGVRFGYFPAVVFCRGWIFLWRDCRDSKHPGGLSRDGAGGWREIHFHRQRGPRVISPWVGAGMYQPWLAGACMAVDGNLFPSPAGNARGEPFIRDEGLAGPLQPSMETVGRKRRAHVFQGRYKSVLVAGEWAEDAHHLKSVADYIHLNPARAGLAEGNMGKLVDYLWSSLRYYPKGNPPEWQPMERVLDAFQLCHDRRGRVSCISWAGSEGGE